MFKKGTKAYSIFNNKCPRCHEGLMFEYHPYNLAKIGTMKTHCDKCNLKYSREPGFFFGAAYVSYMLTVAFGVAGFVATRVLMGESSWQLYLGVVVTILIVMFPITFVWSRTMWINMFVSYEPDVKTEIKE
jgi:uncharacterized protein (DUF983 family)